MPRNKAGNRVAMIGMLATLAMGGCPRPADTGQPDPAGPPAPEQRPNPTVLDKPEPKHTLRPRFVPDKPKEIVIDPKQAVAGLFVVKFAEGSHVRLGPNGLMMDQAAIASNAQERARLARAGLTMETASDELVAVSIILRRYNGESGFGLDYIFRSPGFIYNSADPEADAPFREQDQLEQRSGQELADLDLYYFVHNDTAPALDVQQALMNELNPFRIVEQVYVAVPCAGARDPIPDRTGSQGYLGPAPAGLNAYYAWTKRGGRGEGRTPGEEVRLIDVEYDWVIEHEDFPAASNRFWGWHPAVGPYDPEGSEHGTAVMGIIASPPDNGGITGFASNVQYGLATWLHPGRYAWGAIVATFSGENWGGRAHNVAVAGAIQDGADHLRPGDILLVEQQAFGPVESKWVPVEYYAECFDAIKRITSRGVIVVEAAGNGGQNLDGPAFGERFAQGGPRARHSGALLVGAAGAGDNMVTNYSNTSRRVDVHAWGEGATSIGFGDLDPAQPRERFYTTFTGTSSASAIIAGAMACLQGVRLGAGKTALDPVNLAALLSATGTPQADPAPVIESMPIGKQPNLRAAIDRTLAADGGFAGPGRYTIRSKSSGKVLDIDLDWFHGQDDGQRLMQVDFHGGLNQQFDIRTAGDDSFYLYPRHTTSKVLEVAADGARVQQWSYHTGVNQRFRIQADPRNPGYYFIVSANSSTMVLDVPGFSRERVALQQSTRTGADNQLFEFRPIR